MNALEQTRCELTRREACRRAGGTVLAWAAGAALGLNVGVRPAWAGSFDDFFVAIKRDDVSELERLDALGFDLNTTDTRGQHALFLALREPSLHVAAYLIKHPKVNVDARNPKDETPLMIAVLKGRTAFIQPLLARDADVNKTGWTPLHYAATYTGKGAVEQVQMLLEHHAYIDAESPNGTTPLMMAAQYGSEDVVKLLLEEGADPTLRNALKLTAIDFANRAGRKTAAELIAEKIRSRQPKGKW